MNDSEQVNDRGGVSEKHHHGRKSSESLLDKETILEHLGIAAGHTILDAGCGTGYMSWAFAERLGNRGRVYALDPDETAITVLRERTRGTNILPMVGDITITTRIPSATLDLVYVSSVLVRAGQRLRRRGKPPAETPGKAGRRRNREASHALRAATSDAVFA